MQPPKYRPPTVRPPARLAMQPVTWQALPGRRMKPLLRTENRLQTRFSGASDPKMRQRTVNGRSTDGRVPDLYSTADLPTDGQRTVRE